MNTLRRIYRVQNKLNGMCYVGQTKQTLSKRFHSINPRQLIGKAIKKYGKKNFSIELLEITSASAGDQAERKWIKTMNTYVPNGYNVREGGVCGHIAESTRQKMLGRVVSYATRLKISNARKGQPASEIALRNLMLGRKQRWTPKQRRAAAGEGNPNAMLTKEQVRAIRSLYDTEHCSQEKLGKQFGVKQVTISAVIRRKTWRNS